MPRTLIMTEDEVVAAYRPERDDNGDLFRQRVWWNPADLAEIQRAEDERRLWTMLDCDGVMVLAQGYHRVNREYYVICEVPWNEGDTIEVLDDDDFDREMEA